MKQTFTFREILDNEEGRSLVDQIEGLSREQDPRLVAIREQLISELKEKFGYDY